MLSILVAGYMLLMIPIGIYASRKIKSSKDFVLAGRNLPFFIATATVFATWFGSETVLGISSEFIEGGFSAVITDPFGAGLCLILIGLFYARKLYALNHLTLGDYFEERFGRASAVTLSIFIILTYFGWVAAQFVALGLVMNLVMGVPIIWGMFISVLIVLTYTYFGGMWSVSLTDALQMLIIIVGLLAVVFSLLPGAGGFSNVIASTPPDYFKIAPENSWGGWLAFFGALFTIGLGSIAQQDVYQRVMSSKSKNVAVWATISAGFLYFTVALIPLLIGLIARVSHPELLSMEDHQYILPTMILNYSSLWIQVLFFGALLSAIMSTASGALLAPATLLGENVIRPIFPKMSDTRKLFVIRVSILGVAAIAFLMALSEGKITTLVADAYSIGLVSTFIPLTFGLYTKIADQKATLLSAFLGIVGWQYVEIFMSEDYIVPSVIMGLLCSLIGMIIGIAWRYAYQKLKNV